MKVLLKEEEVNSLISWYDSYEIFSRHHHLPHHEHYEFDLQVIKYA